MNEWRITGRISPRNDGSMEVDLRAERVGQARKSSPRVSAMTADDIAATIELAKGEMPRELVSLAEQMVDLMASTNKGGSVALGRALREVYAPLAKAASSSDYPASALVYGMEQALAKGVPNVNYAKKAAAGFTEALPASSSVGASVSRYDIIGGGSDARE